MTRPIKIASIILSLLLVSTLAIPAFAGISTIKGNCGFANCEGEESFSDLRDTIFDLINGVLIVVTALAVAYLVYAGYRYLTARGNEEGLVVAKRQIAYAALGLIVVGGAEIIVYSVINQDAEPIATNLIIPYINMAQWIVGVVATIYIIFNAYLYISSSGDEQKIGGAKKGILYGLAGLVIVGAAQIIVIAILSRNTTDLEFLVIRPVVNAVLTLAGVFAVAYLILGGYNYITSQGDEQKAASAKRQIIYSLIGVLIIVLSAAIVNFILIAAVV